MKKISIFGATGSIGKNTLEIIEQNSQNFQIIALTAANNYQLLAKQAKKFQPKLIALKNEKYYQKLKSLLIGENIEILSGKEAIIQAASLKADLAVCAIIGIAGFMPLIEAIKNCHSIAIANKESLVCGGKIVNNLCKQHGCNLLPIDSEHSAIFQLLHKTNHDKLESIIITASGGPFRDLAISQLPYVTPEQAIKHPNWSMGNKISVDSATMMNKGLEVIEAHHLFNLPPNKIKILVHPQSIIHAMVNFHDGSSIAQISSPDMKIPISQALYWPEIAKNNCKNIKLENIASLEFEKVDYNKFPSLKIALDVLENDVKNDTNLAVVMNAANEIAVDSFLQKKIRFTEIATIIEKTLEKSSAFNLITPKDLENADNESRKLAYELTQKYNIKMQA